MEIVKKKHLWRIYIHLKNKNYLVFFYSEKNKINSRGHTEDICREEKIYGRCGRLRLYICMYECVRIPKLSLMYYLKYSKFNVWRFSRSVVKNRIMLPVTWMTFQQQHCPAINPVISEANSHKYLHGSKVPDQIFELQLSPHQTVWCHSHGDTQATSQCVSTGFLWYVWYQIDCMHTTYISVRCTTRPNRESLIWTEPY